MVFSPLKLGSVNTNLSILICSLLLSSCGGDTAQNSYVEIPDDLTSPPQATAITNTDNQAVNLQARAENAEFHIQDTGSSLSISIAYQDIVSAPHTQIFLNTDNDTSTGFGFDGVAWGMIGADYMVQNQYLFESSSNTSSWDWQVVGKIEGYASTDNQIEMSINKSLIGAPCGTIQAGTMGRNDTWGVEVMYPVSTALMSIGIRACLEDVTRPMVNLVGDAEITVTQGDSFIDPGATAIDNIDGDISSTIYTDGSVNTAILGNYVLVYISTDSSGNVAISPVRKVTVVESDVPLPPVALNGNWDLLANKQTVYAEQGSMTILTASQDPTTKDIYLFLSQYYGFNAGHIQTYLDTDNDPTTGYQVWNRQSPAAITGAEYLIENGRMTKYIGTGSDWSWSADATETPYTYQATLGEREIYTSTVKSILPSSVVTGDTLGITTIYIRPDWSLYYLMTKPGTYRILTPESAN